MSQFGKKKKKKRTIYELNCDRNVYLLAMCNSQCNPHNKRSMVALFHISNQLDTIGR